MTVCCMRSEGNEVWRVQVPYATCVLCHLCVPSVASWLEETLVFKHVAYSNKHHLPHLLLGSGWASGPDLVKGRFRPAVSPTRGQRTNTGRANGDYMQQLSHCYNRVCGFSMFMSRTGWYRVVSGMVKDKFVCIVLSEYRDVLKVQLWRELVTVIAHGQDNSIE